MPRENILLCPACVRWGVGCFAQIQDRLVLYPGESLTHLRSMPGKELEEKLSVKWGKMDYGCGFP